MESLAFLDLDSSLVGHMVVVLALLTMCSLLAPSSLSFVALPSLTFLRLIMPSLASPFKNPSHLLLLAYLIILNPLFPPPTLILLFASLMVTWSSLSITSDDFSPRTPSPTLGMSPPCSTHLLSPCWSPPFSPFPTTPPRSPLVPLASLAP